MRGTFFIETFRISIQSLLANKLRSILASLGVVVGISFVILTGWLLSGLDNVMMDTFNIIGRDMLYVDKWDWAGGKSWKEVRQRKDITLEQTNEFIKRINSAELSIPNMRNWATNLKYGNNSYSGFSVIGTSHEHALTPAGTILKGRHFSQFEAEIGEKVIVIGFKVYETLFPKGDAIGQIIKVNGHKFTVIGVITKQGTIFFDMIDNQCFIPMKAFVKAFGKSRRSLSIAVKAGSEENLDEVRAETRGIMRILRNVRPGEEDDFSINETKAFERNVETIRFWVWFIGISLTVLSFIVGIIGIMNIMFVSVTERTKEIGIRKAVGAKKSSILLQFIIESATLSVLGAILAFLGCSVLVYILSIVLPKIEPSLAFLTATMPYMLLFIAALVSVFVGILAGLIPAYRASNLDPVDSLRYE